MAFPVRGRSLPSIRVLFALAGIAILTPLVAIASTEYRAATTRVEDAEIASVSVARLDALLRFASAVSDERNASGAALGVSVLPDDVPAFVGPAIGMDFDETLRTSRIRVDRLLDRLAAPDLGAGLRSVRQAVDEKQLSVGETIDRYESIADDVAALIEEEQARLSIAAAGAGADDDLVAAVRIAEAAAALHIVSAGLITEWAPLAAPFATPSSDDIGSVSESIAVQEYASEQLDSLIEENTELSRLWNDPSRIATSAELIRRLEQTVDRYTLEDRDPSPDAEFEFDPSSIDFGSLIAEATEMGTVIDMGTEASAQLSAIVDAALADVTKTADELSAKARETHRSVMLLIAVSTLFVVGGGFVLVRSIVRPVGRMADAADSLRDGLLDERVPESGPKELRVAASAMNEAIDSLKLAETQAVALADERLDDPVLNRPAPGRLGSSLRAAVSHLTSTLTERDEFQRRLAHEASHDGLTRLPNRKASLAHLSSALARTRRASTSVALLFLDFDEFKTINDQNGHHAGDAVLKAMAQRVSNVIRQGDLAGRIGGDEFVVIAEPVDGVGEAVDLAERIVECVGSPVVVGDLSITASVSVGIAVSNGTDLTGGEMLRDADLAVYRAKELGRSRVHVCDEILREQLVERTNIEHAVKTGITQNEFCLHYQPTVDSRSGVINSLEALVRWNRPGHGTIAPGEFIPIAENSDLILDIDRWVLKRVAAQIADWNSHAVLRELPTAINISSRHLSAGCLVESVTAAIESSNIAPERLVLEITETALLDDLDTASRDLARLRDLGVRIALDDFGTGYMSLATLRSLPIDVLKIDRSFVAHMEMSTEHSLVELIVNTGHLLGMKVTAEGVETTQQLERLSRIGSDNLQGFLFSQPVEPEVLLELLADPTNRTGHERVASAIHSNGS